MRHTTRNSTTRPTSRQGSYWPIPTKSCVRPNVGCWGLDRTYSRFSQIDANKRALPFRPPRISGRSHLAPSAFGTETFSFMNDLFLGLRKMRGIHGPSPGERCVPYGRDHERHFPDRSRFFHLDWNDLKCSRCTGQRAADAKV